MKTQLLVLLGLLVLLAVLGCSIACVKVECDKKGSICKDSAASYCCSKRCSGKRVLLASGGVLGYWKKCE
ncbi:hypothetical protein BOX15_Mlig004682g2 [Macrostomum lignano]|uniref:Uncharacterized protein n=1 Tax=Macrostomum lignano TaxID=282301 RepID=A0A267GJV9_9PLAT|nr:hypothetical protein BOX15_Mlig004682g2 [Macrostomum lignano]